MLDSADHPPPPNRPHPPRILLYLDDGLQCGGAEKVAQQLLTRWNELGWEVHLAARHPPEDSFYSVPSGTRCWSLYRPTDTAAPTRRKPSAGRTKLPFMPWPTVRTAVRLLHEARLLRKVLIQANPDILISFLTPGNIKALIASRGLQGRVLISERNDTRHYRYDWIWQVLRRLLYRHADLVTANLVASVDDMKRYVPEERLRFVPNPIDLQPKDRRARPQDSRRILLVGRLVDYKQQDLAIHAFSALAGNFPDWEMDIVGDGPERERLQELAEGLGLSGKIQFHGRQESVSQYYRSAAVFVQPSRVEGTPNALLEAMSHGLPCIVSAQIEACAELIDHEKAAMRFSGAHEELANALEKLMVAPENRRSLGMRASKALAGSTYAVAQQAWEKIALELIKAG